MFLEHESVKKEWYKSRVLMEDLAGLKREGEGSLVNLSKVKDN